LGEIRQAIGHVAGTWAGGVEAEGGGCGIGLRTRAAAEGRMNEKRWARRQRVACSLPTRCPGLSLRPGSTRSSPLAKGGRKSRVWGRWAPNRTA